MGVSVFFYISGHGFGHAIRQIEIIDAFVALLPAVRIVIRTTAPRWLFERTLLNGGDPGTAPSSSPAGTPSPRCAARARYTLIEGAVDTGVVQHDSLRLDEAETIRRAMSFYRELDRRGREEAALLEHQRAAFVVSDAPPLACAAAARAGVRSAVCSNFTWDWIYAGYTEHLASAPELLPRIRDAYAFASQGWRLPMHGGFDAIAPIVDVPFVARQSAPRLTRDEIRRRLGLPLGRPLALVSFGGYGVDGLALHRLDCAQTWSVIVVGSRSSEPRRIESASRDRNAVIVLAEDTVYASGLRYEHLVRAADVVVSKPGYGIISDCVANDTALLYTSRGRFAEYDVLIAEMPRYLRCRFIDGADLRAGRWLDALDALLAGPRPPERPPTDGAQVVAEMLAGYL